jgi:hypothetical protein
MGHYFIEPSNYHDAPHKESPTLHQKCGTDREINKKVKHNRSSRLQCKDWTGKDERTNINSELWLDLFCLSFKKRKTDLPHNATFASLPFSGYTNRLIQDWSQQQWNQVVHQHMSDSGHGSKVFSGPSVGSVGGTQLGEPTPSKDHLPLMKDQPFL